jgi:hypothetical protein
MAKFADVVETNSTQFATKIQDTLQRASMQINTKRRRGVVNCPTLPTKDQRALHCMTEKFTRLDSVCTSISTLRLDVDYSSDLVYRPAHVP